MKVISKIAIVLAVGVLMSAGLNNVFATCGVPGTTFTSNYYDTTVTNDPAATVGSFWGIGQFNPASPGGSDNGNVPSSTWLRYLASGPGFYLASDWSSEAYDGCIQDAPNPQPAKMGAAWTASDGVNTFFVALCVGEDGSGTFGDFVTIPGGQMSQVPKPRINASSRTGNITNLTVGHQPLSGGVGNGPGCTLAVTGFKIYQQTVPRNAPAPSAANSRRPSSGWTLLGQGTESAADVAGQVTCGTDSDVYLMTTLILDGNVELSQGSANSTHVECGPNVANPTGEGSDFRFIRKPKSAKGR